MVVVYLLATSLRRSIRQLTGTDMRFNSFYEGLTILKTYMLDLSNPQTNTEHDEFFVQVDYAPTTEDQEKLECLGWEDDGFGTEGLGWKAFM
jgi:hypothetical protein